MTLALDINPLIYASANDSPFHDIAESTISAIVKSGEVVYLFWPVAVGYIRVATGPGIAGVPLTLLEATGNIERLLALPQVRSEGEMPGFWQQFIRSGADAQARGKMISDVHIVALMRQHGVSRILTHDRDFRKFDGIRVVDPFA
jgi:toxin-antitoxin system PIN domain toxin